MSLPATRSGLIARNSIINFVGQFVPLVVGVLSIPFVVRGLGVDSFGILSLSWMLLGYFTVFDLGLGRATTKFVAEELRNGATERFRTLFWTSSVMNLLLGLAGGLVVGVLAPVLAESVFRIPPELVGKARAAFLLLAISTPVVLLSTAFRGALEASQRFEHVNSVAVVSSSLTYLLPVAGIFWGLDVVGIIVLLIISRAGSAMAYLLFCMKLFPILKQGMAFDFKRVRTLVSYGGWIATSNVISPALTYFDRLFIGSAISVAAVAYYTAPYEMITRLWILPTSLTLTLFPAFSAIGTTSKDILTSLYARSIKYLVLLISPAVMLLTLFAGQFLRLWLGVDFADKSTAAFQILAVGVLFNSIAQIPCVLIQGLGRPDITAKFHLIELVLYIPLVWLLVSTMGITGGGLAWSLRVVIDCAFLILASRQFIHSPLYLEKGLVGAVGVTAVMAVVSVVLLWMNASVFTKAITSGIVVIILAPAAWRYVLAADEKNQLRWTAQRLVSLVGGTR